MTDTKKLRDAIRMFEFNSSPSSSSSSEPANVGDIKKLIQNTAILFNTFVDELEQEN